MVVILIVGSELLLRPHFPDNTHALVDAWASMAFYVIFFLSGFVLLSNKHIIESIRKQRKLFLAEATVATVVMFSSPQLFERGPALDFAWGLSSIFLAWSCGLAAIGYARQYLNRDSRFRKLANEAIYPFYLLHQPVILIIGFFLIKVQMPDLVRLLILTVSSFAISAMLYWYLVRPFNLTRIIFGMKPLAGRKSVSAMPQQGTELVPETI